MSDKYSMPKKGAKRTLVLLLSLIGCCVLIYGLYRILLANFNPEVVLISYMAVATAVVLGYVIYNRGFSRKGITPEMLPDSWSAEKKEDFINDAKLRLMKSKPVLILVIAFLFTFILEAFELVVIPFLAEFFATLK
jgi:hypothetical protein